MPEVVDQPLCNVETYMNDAAPFGDITLLLFDRQ